MLVRVIWDCDWPPPVCRLLLSRTVAGRFMSNWNDTVISPPAIVVEIHPFPPKSFPLSAANLTGNKAAWKKIGERSSPINVKLRLHCGNIETSIEFILEFIHSGLSILEKIPHPTTSKLS